MVGKRRRGWPRRDADQHARTLDKYSRDHQDGREGKPRSGHRPCAGDRDHHRGAGPAQENNPVLIGEPGVGKTAIVEGLAQRMVAGEVPENAARQASGGTQHQRHGGRRQVSRRVRGARAEGAQEVTEHQGEMILFIDEVHTIVGAGQGGGEGGLDVANVQTDDLARGELNLIGATTLNEYQKYIEKDAALERRFQPVMVPEPTVAQTMMILRGLRDTFEAHHKVSITEDAIIAAAELSDRIHHRALFA